MDKYTTQFEFENFDQESDKFVRFVQLMDDLRNKYACFKGSDETLSGGGAHFNKYNVNNKKEKDVYYKKTTPIKRYVKPLVLQRLDHDDSSIQVIRSQLNKLSTDNFPKICYYINFKLNNIDDLVTLIFKFCETSNVYTNLYTAILLYSSSFLPVTKKKELIKTVHAYFQSLFDFDSKTSLHQAMWCKDSSYDEFCMEVKVKKQHVNHIHFLYFMSQSEQLQLECFHKKMLGFYVDQAKESYRAEQIDWKNIEFALDSCIAWCSINAQQKFTLPVYLNDHFVNTKTKNLIHVTDLKECVKILDGFDFSKNLKLKFKLLDLKELMVTQIQNSSQIK